MWQSIRHAIRATLPRVGETKRARNNRSIITGEQTMTLEITGEPPHVDAVIARLGGVL
jgi:threonine dehydratase